MKNMNSAHDASTEMDESDDYAFLYRGEPLPNFLIDDVEMLKGVDVAFPLCADHRRREPGLSRDDLLRLAYRKARVFALWQELTNGRAARI